MSHYIPLDIQKEIMKSLPVISLIHFRSVSKEWKFFIDSSEFVHDYHARHKEPHHLIISNKKTKPVTFNPRILRKSRGLLLGSCRGIDNKESNGVLWNPLIRKGVAIDVPSVVSFCITTAYTVHAKTVVGFGVCRRTNGPKIVRITNSIFCTSEVASAKGNTIKRLWKVRAFTFRSGTWKRQPFIRSCLDESIYWLAFDGRAKRDSVFKWYDLIMSIDMISEEFTQENVRHSLSNIQLPLASARKEKRVLATARFKDLVVQAGEQVGLFISNLKMHLVKEEAAQVYNFWVHDETAPKSLLERFNVGEPRGCIKKACGERNYGECVNGGSGDDFEQDALFIYKPHSHEINSIRIFGKRYAFFAWRKRDQLFLLDH